MCWRRISPPASPGVEKDTFNESTVFGSLHSTVLSQAFKGGSVSTIFGECFVDLSKAAIAPGEHAFRVHGVFGNTNIVLPKDCAVSVTASSILGGLTILGQEKNGIANELTMSTPGYESSPNRLKITISKVLGNSRIA